MDKLYDLLRTSIASRTSLGSLAGLFTALLIVLRYRQSKRSRLVSNVLNLDGKQYDIIIVGGGKRLSGGVYSILIQLYALGTAGCALASRLSENPSIKVLLLEAGGRYVPHPVYHRFRSRLLKANTSSDDMIS